MKDLFWNNKTYIYVEGISLVFNSVTIAMAFIQACLINKLLRQNTESNSLANP